MPMTPRERTAASDWTRTAMVRSREPVPSAGAGVGKVGVLDDHGFGGVGGGGSEGRLRKSGQGQQDGEEGQGLEAHGVVRV